MRQLRRLLLGWGAGARARAEEREARDTWCWDWTRAAVSTKSCTRFRATCGTIFMMDEILISMSGAACRLCVRPPILAWTFLANATSPVEPSSATISRYLRSLPSAECTS